MTSGAWGPPRCASILTPRGGSRKTDVVRGTPNHQGAVAATRAWLVDTATDAAARKAFDEHTRRQTAVYFRWLGLAISGAALLWWPTDWIVYADEPRARWAMGVFRATLIVVTVGLAFTIPYIEWFRRRAHYVAVACTLIDLSFAGWMAAEAGHGDPFWLTFGYAAPLFAVLLLLPLPGRALATLSAVGAFYTAWLAHPATTIDAPNALAVLSFMVFCALISIGIGHGFYVLMRRDFHLRRQIERQRASLAKLADRLENRVADQTRSLTKMHHRAQHIRAEQRVELARDLHDGLGQELTSLRLLVGLGHHLDQEEDPGELLVEVDGQVARVQQSLRRVLRALRPQKLDELGLPEALSELAGQLARRSGLSITLTRSEDLPEILPTDLSVALYRIAQEGLTNAIRHARARKVSLRLETGPGTLIFRVQDDGIGIPSERHLSGLGTQGIVERAEALGGQVRWHHQDGTCLTVTFPLPEHP